MKTIHVTLPHDLVLRAIAAGFLSAEAIQEMLRRLLLLRVSEPLRQIHRRMPDKELTPQIEQEFVEAVQGYQVQRRG